MIDKVKEKTECIIDEILEEGISVDNIDMLGKVIDIHKDVANEEYWKTKEEFMMYGNRGYGNYPSMNYGARGRDSRGRYNEGGNYGNYGTYGRRYRGHDMMDDMSEQYSRYMDERQSGNYNGPETTEALEYMLESLVQFVNMLKQDASSQDEMEMIRHYTKKISEM